MFNYKEKTMSEILNSIRLKDKITIATAMAALAVILATLIGVMTYCTADRHNHIYEYTLEAKDEGFNLVGVCTVDNCEDPYFRQDDLTGVNLLSAVTPTCSKEGNRVYTYTHNGVTLKFTEILEPAPHTYDYEMVEGDGVIYLNGKCSNDDCTDPYIFINDITSIELIESVPGTCFSPRKETYSYVSGSSSGTFVTLVEEDIPHTLCGVLADKLQNENGEYIYGTEGIMLRNTDDIVCGSLVDGYFVCEVCRNIDDDVKVRYPDHRFVYNESGVTLPTTEADGVAVLKCQNASCATTLDIVIPKVESGVNAVVKSPATELHREVVTYTFVSEEYGFTIQGDYEVGEVLSHNYVYRLMLNKDENGLIDTEKIDLVGRCDQPDCQTPEIRKENVETTFEDTSTCMSPGEYIWTYDHNGETLVLKVIRTELGSHKYFFDGDKNNVAKPSLEEAGWVKLCCSTEGCDYRLVVELPKIEVGVNATVESSGDGYVVYAYEYLTNYDCTVSLKIFVEE